MRRLAWTLVLAAVAGPALAQSLAEIAARDQERRAREKSRSAPAYTDSDLKASPSPTPVVWSTASPKPRGWKAPASPSPPPAPAGRPAVSPPPTPEPPDRSAEQRAALEARWRAVALARREALSKSQARVAELEARITALRNDLSPVDLGNPNREQTRQAEIGRAQQELDAARAAHAAAQKAVDDLEDDARRAGALPGWVR